MPGPPPKREAERRRRNKDSIQTQTVDLDELIKADVEIPVENENWEPLTKQFWASFSRSGQSIFYEPTDWMTAYYLMEVLDRWLKPQDVKVGQIGSEKDAAIGGEITYIFEPKIVAIPGATLNSILKGLTALMATEGDRRRLRIELERKKAMDAALSGDGVVVPIEQHRHAAFERAKQSRPQEA